MLRELLDEKAKFYFVGISIKKSEPEEFFDEFFKGEKYYITKDKEIRRYRKDLNGKCVVHDIKNFKFPSNSIVFVPQASSWNKDSYYPWERYVNFAENLFSNGAEKIIFGYIEEDAHRWKMDVHTFLTQIEKEFYEQGHTSLVEISYKNRILLCVDSQRSL